MADRVVITDIYASMRENDDLGVSGKLLTQEVKKRQPKAIFRAGEKEAADYLAEIAGENDVILTMGAGDIFLWHDSILKALKNNEK